MTKAALAFVTLTFAVSAPTAFGLAVSESASTPSAKALFVAHCGSCHTLAAAGTKGKVGPALAQAQYTVSTVVNQVTEGGGGMPGFATTLTPKQIRAIAAFVVHATGGSQPALATVTSSRPYTAKVVIRAFSHGGISLFDTSYGTLEPVVALQQLAPPRAWSVGVYIYLTPKLASSTFDAEQAQWRASGFSVIKVENVVVAVVPKGHILGKRAPAAPLPAPVAKALGLLRAS